MSADTNVESYEKFTVTLFNPTSISVNSLDQRAIALMSSDQDLDNMYNKLYDSDLQLWIEQTIQQLQNREFVSLDVEHLIQELVDLGKSQKNTLKSNIKIFLIF